MRDAFYRTPCLGTRTTTLPHSLSRTSREFRVRCVLPCPECLQTRQAWWLAAKQRSNARATPERSAERVRTFRNGGGQHTKKPATSTSFIKGSHSCAPQALNVPPLVTTAGPAGSAPFISITSIQPDTYNPINYQQLAMLGAAVHHCQQP